MSIRIYWDRLGEEQAQRAQQYLNGFFKNLPNKPDMVGDIVVTSFTLGNTPPVIRIVDICDPPPLPKAPEAPASAPVPRLQRQNSASVLELGLEIHHQRLKDSNNRTDVGHPRNSDNGQLVLSSSMSALPSPARRAVSSSSLSQVSSPSWRAPPFLLGGLRGSRMSFGSPSLHPAVVHLSRARRNSTASVLSTSTSTTAPLPSPSSAPHSETATANGSANNSVNNDNRASNPTTTNNGKSTRRKKGAVDGKRTSKKRERIRLRDMVSDTEFEPVQTEQARRRLFDLEGHEVMPSQQQSTAAGLKKDESPRIVDKDLDIQIKVFIKYTGNTSITIKTELIVNMPRPRFIVLPIEITISEIAIKGTACITHRNGAVSLYFEDDHKHQEHSPLKHFKVDLKMGDMTQGQATNAHKVEQFIVSELKTKLVEAVVHPNLLTLFDLGKQQPASGSDKGPPQLTSLKGLF